MSPKLASLYWLLKPYTYHATIGIFMGILLFCWPFLCDMRACGWDLVAACEAIRSDLFNPLSWIGSGVVAFAGVARSVHMYLEGRIAPDTSEALLPEIHQ